MEERNITKRILVPLSLTLIGLCVIVVLSVTWFGEKSITTTAHKDFEEIEKFWNLELDEDGALMTSVIETLIYEAGTNKDKTLQKALRSKDKAALLAHSMDLFKTLRTKHKITHFYYHSPERVNILRVHQVERSGDKINRFTAIQAEEKNDTALGLELGLLGTFTLRVVVPWYDGEELLGYIELGKEVDDLVHIISELNEVELLISINKEFLDRENWTDGMKMLGRKFDWDSHSDKVVISNTLELSQVEHKSLLLFASEEYRNHTNDHETLDLKGRLYHLDTIILHDVGGREVGSLMILNDMSEVVLFRRNIIKAFIAISFTVSLSIFLLFYRILARTDRDLLSKRRKIVEDAKAKEDMQKEHILELETEKRDLEEAKESINRSYQVERVLNSIRDFSFRDVTLNEILVHSLDEILSIPFLSIEDKGSIFLTEDGNEDMLTMVAKHGLSEYIENECSRVAFGRCLCGRAAETKKIVFKGTMDEEHENTYEGIAVHGHFCVPIISGDVVLGVINTYLPNGLERSLEDERFLRMTANMLSGIILRKKSEDTIEQLAYYDQLTGLPNRALFMDRLKQSLARASRYDTYLGLLFMDLDHFKNLNDTFGHVIGDKFLKSAAERLKTFARTSDSVARLSGDEFLFFVGDQYDANGIAVVAGKVSSIFKEPFNIDGNEFFMTVSIGVSIYPNDGKDVTTLMKNADTAMYKAKVEGGGAIHLYTASMNERALERLELENRLRRALERDEFYLDYQAQVDIETFKVVGVEALIRWRSEHLGFVSPDEFIPVAETTRLIVPIGEWVLREACEEMVRLHNQGLKDLCVAVNVSLYQLKDRSFFDTLSSVLEETGLDPKYLELEITESVAMDNVEESVRLLNELKNKGIRLSIDDFGTGYSSLEHLKRMPIDVLKIDMSFIRNITEDDDDKKIVETIVKIGHGFNCKVIAEGVETPEQLEVLRDVGCDIIQGYLFSKPVAPKELKGVYDSVNQQSMSLDKSKAFEQ